MKYNKFKNICNECIFLKNKKDLLSKIVNYEKNDYIYNVYESLFLTKTIIDIQNSNFTVLFKKLFEKYFSELGYKNLNKRIITDDSSVLDLDQLFTDNKYIYFIEQKVRDDHDSTKKRGQIDNFEKKISELIKIYNEKQLKTYTYFIDPNLIKNKNYYQDKINKISSDYDIYSKLCYGKEFWIDIEHSEIWDELLKYLEQWKKEIPDMPSINFDEDPQKSFEEIKDLSVAIYRKLFDNKDICKEILPIIFPTTKTLKLLKNYFEQLGKEKGIYKSLAEKINFNSIQ